MTTRLAVAMLAVQLGAPTAAAASDAPSATTHGPTFTNLHGEVVLDNARVHVEKFLLPPGQSTGLHLHPGNQLMVFIKGGVLTSNASHRSTLWREGRIAWQSADDPADDGSTNTGPSTIELVCVTLKPVVAVAAPPGQSPKYRYLNYPNIPGEDLLDNDYVIVQRFVVNPGQWEGVHAHHPDMLYIHVKGGQWAARSKKEPEHTYPDASRDGSVGWMSTIDINEGHESGNIGSTPIDLIWVTLKR
jgi:quercetin dioxygenase-like cupin family protein